MEDNPPCDVHTEKLRKLEEETSDQWKHINKLEGMMHKLVPFWVALVLMVMSFVTGGALTFAGMILRMK